MEQSCWCVDAAWYPWGEIVFAFRLLAMLLMFTCVSAVGQGPWAIADDFAHELKLPAEPEPVLNKILSTNEFKESNEKSFWDSIEELKAAIWWKIVKYLDFHMPELKWNGKGADVIWIVLGCLLISVVVVLVYLTVRRLMERAKEQIPSAFPSDESLTGTGSADFRTKASELAAKGNYSSTVINLFRYVLSWLDEQNRIALYGAKTNREILLALRNDPARPLVVQLAPLFNAVRYGNKACDKSDYERYLNLCVEIAET